jgi:hypothetical protein
MNSDGFLTILKKVEGLEQDRKRALEKRTAADADARAASSGMAEAATEFAVLVKQMPMEFQRALAEELEAA